MDGLFINAGGYFLLPFIYGEGGDLVDAAGKKIVVNSDKNVAGIKVAQDLVKSGAAVKPPANDSYGTMMTLFKEGKVAMIINGPWEVDNIPRPEVRRHREPRHRPGPGRLAPRPAPRSAATTTSSGPAWRGRRPRRRSRS